MFAPHTHPNYLEVYCAEMFHLSVEQKSLAGAHVHRWRETVINQGFLSGWGIKPVVSGSRLRQLAAAAQR